MIRISYATKRDMNEKGKIVMILLQENPHRRRRHDLLVTESPSSGLIQTQGVIARLLLPRNLLWLVLVAVLVVTAQHLHSLLLVA